MRKTVFAGAAALAGLWLAAMWFQGRRAPAYTATATVPALGLTVTTELFVLSEFTEFERRLTLAAGGATLRARMADSHGPADRAGVYRVGDGGTEIAVVGPAGDAAFFAVGPLRRLDRPSRAAADWTCLGAFELSLKPDARDPLRGRVQALAFVPATREGAVPATEGGPQACPPPAAPPV